MLLTVMTACNACGKKPDGPDGPDGPDVPTPPAVDDEQKMTDYFIVEDGQCSYKIVSPDDADRRIITAGDELKLFFSQSTGIQLDEVSESELASDYSGNMIVLGETAQTRAAGITVDHDTIGVNGYQMKTVGKNVYITGGIEYGTLFGVYEFLRRTLDYEIYAADCWTIRENAKTVQLPDFDLKVVPEIQQIMANYGAVRNDVEFGLRMGYQKWEEIWMYVDGANCHNTLKYVPVDKYGTDHPEWFSEDKKQICMSNEEMYQQVLLPRLKEVIDANPDLLNVSVTQMDDNSWCTCKDCKADFEKYGTDAGNMIKFINKCARDIKAWLKERGTERKINFVLFAYHKTTNAPAVFNEVTKKYEPIDEDVICDEDVVVWYAPIYSVWKDSFYEPSNATEYENSQKWDAVCKTKFVWAYETCFSQYLVPFNTFNSMQDNFRFYKEIDTQMLFSQGQFNQQSSNGFNNLKIFLNTKLRWNVNADLAKLTQEFFDNYFGAASDAMMGYFDTLRRWWTYQEEVLNYPGTVYATTTSEKWWTVGILDKFDEYIQEAYKAIEYLKDEDIALYETIYDHICLESITNRYLSLALYSTLYSSNDLYEMRRAFRADVLRLNIGRLKENGALESFYSSWAI